MCTRLLSSNRRAAPTLASCRFHHLRNSRKLEPLALRFTSTPNGGWIGASPDSRLKKRRFCQAKAAAFRFWFTTEVLISHQRTVRPVSLIGLNEQQIASDGDPDAEQLLDSPLRQVSHVAAVDDVVPRADLAGQGIRCPGEVKDPPKQHTLTRVRGRRGRPADECGKRCLTSSVTALC